MQFLEVKSYLKIKNKEVPSPFCKKRDFSVFPALRHQRALRITLTDTWHILGWQVNSEASDTAVCASPPPPSFTFFVD